jgi:hypothetical protein
VPSGQPFSFFGISAYGDFTSLARLRVYLKGKEMIEFLHRVLRSRYVRMLDGEVARLRMENRALMNSLLGTAGFPPVEFAEAVKPVELPRMRRRSWQQIQRKNESEAVKGCGGE